MHTRITIINVGTIYYMTMVNSVLKYIVVCEMALTYSCFG